MFDPNPIATFEGLQFSHRSPTFHRLLLELETIFKDKFGIPKDWIIMFLTGSGTLANEAVIYSIGPIEFQIVGADYEFKHRLIRLQREHLGGLIAEGLYKMFVHYESADSYLNLECLSIQAELCAADMVSAFPYYEPYKSVDIWTTVSGKQLGALPVISIIVMNQKALKACAHFGEDALHGSVLSLWDYYNAYCRKETPHTAAIPLYWDLHQRLKAFDLEAHRKRIDERRSAIECITKGIGEGPIFTFKENQLPADFVDKWGLFRGKSKEIQRPQLYLYSEPDEIFERFIKELSAL